MINKDIAYKRHKKTAEIGLYSSDRLLNRLVILVGICLFALQSFSYANTEDGAIYAKEQNEKAKQLTAPYVNEVNQLVKSVLSKQAGNEISSIQKGFKISAKSTCPMQRQLVAEQDRPQLSQAASSVLIFVSFSMPVESIKGWIRQAQKINASVYIRGLVNNSFKDTAKAVSGLVYDQKGGLLIDPNVFKEYGIIQVPAVVVVKGDNKKSGKQVKEKNDFDVIYGDVFLDYALEKISKDQRGESKGLAKAVNKIRGLDKK